MGTSDDRCTHVACLLVRIAFLYKAGSRSTNTQRHWVISLARRPGLVKRTLTNMAQSEVKRAQLVSESFGGCMHVHGMTHLLHRWVGRSWCRVRSVVPLVYFESDGE